MIRQRTYFEVVCDVKGPGCVGSYAADTVNELRRDIRHTEWQVEVGEGKAWWLGRSKPDACPNCRKQLRPPSPPF